MADPGKPSRRDLFKGAALAGVAASGAGAAQAQPPAPVRREALETLSAAEADILEAFCARLIPSDETGPGAREARAAHYIDRSLAGALSASRETYRAGLLALDARALRMKLIPFHRLNETDQDAVLVALEKEDLGFFGLVRGHALQGTFGDPYYGGNAGFVGWDMIGYPGIRLGVTQPQQTFEPHLQKVRMSAYDFAMFDRSGARVAEAQPAPVDHMHMASGMGDAEHDR
jgi:gluconate 2-dehydrogenase gamma chain